MSYAPLPHGVTRFFAVLRVMLLMTIANQRPAEAQQAWPVHSTDRPRPPVVTPGTPRRTPPPADAIVLFDGRSLAAWQRGDKPAGWKVEHGYAEVVRGAGSIQTRRTFGDIQLHLEWAAPAVIRGEGQGRGNSGVFLMGHYEVQILDSYGNDTYPDGQAGALYGQHPPLVNASLGPGEWQSYDIIFHRPRFNPDGTVREPARATVFHNGVLIHDHQAFTGLTTHGAAAVYRVHADRGPIELQDHGDPVRFRNIWVRELPERLP